MSRIKGIDIAIILPETTETDPFGAVVNVETKKEIVSNVLIAPASSSEIIDSTNLYGKKAVYTLAIPKGDTHDWRNVKVEFFGKTWQTFGEPLEGIENLIPLDWNKKVMVDLYE